MNQINQSVDILIQHQDDIYDQTDYIQMPKLSQLNLSLIRPVYSIYQRDILYIQDYFKEKNCLLLRTYAGTNLMYLCNKSEFEQKVLEYFTQTKAYELLKQCSDTNQNNFKYLYYNLFNHIDEQLYELFHHGLLTFEQYTQMISYNRPKKFQLHSMIFLPDIRIPEVPCRPIMINGSEPMINIAQFLYQYLQTIYTTASHSTTFNNSIDVIKAIETYTKKGFLNVRTLFVTLEIKDFDITFDHQRIIDTLKCFLDDFLPRTSSLSSTTITTIVNMILNMQYFIYNNKLYRQIKGSNPESQLTQLLVNIYLYYWQQYLLQFLQKRNELFGRCYNTMFFTWNGLKRQFYTIFNRIKRRLPNLPIQFSIGTSIRYLDVEMTQINGNLQTNIYHSCLQEKYTISYLSKYPLDEYAHLIRAQLIQAIHLCNNIQDFRNEYLFILRMYVINRFPLAFIDNCFKKFFNEFNPSKLNYRYNQKVFENLRQHVMTTNSQISELSIHNNKRSYQNDMDNEINIKRMKI